MFEQVVEFITRYSMFAPGSRVGAAVSGGADSVCLLHVLLHLAPRWNLHLTVLHLNHNLRAAESDADEQFVRALAARLNLPALIQPWRRQPEGLNPSPQPPDPSPRSQNLEESAREARLAFFTQAIATVPLDRVALGHTRSDQAETVLFRLLRGAGTAGLSGIRPVTPSGIVRPLLGVNRSEVEAFLRERGIPWREDSSNASHQFARNRIRHDLLPQLAREWNPAIAETLANTADWALAEESYWEAEIARLAPECLRETGGAVIMRTEALRSLPLAAARRMVRHAMALVKGDLRSIDFGHTEAVLQMAAVTEGHGRFQAPGLDILRSLDWVRFALPGADTLENRNYRFAAAVPGAYEIPGEGGNVHLELIEKPETLASPDCVYNGESDTLDWERISGPLELRNWRPGDRYRPAGRSAEEKIKTLFQEARIPLWERRHWPVLTDGSSILWSRRFGPAERYAAPAGARVALVVRDSGNPREEWESDIAAWASIVVLGLLRRFREFEY